ncbi:hypothetical protein [Chamaesiphon sp. VAR_69_metabat_338]|uniref:hypothetical protein n=1 Tax=Chamaesiphon sp. VAR_69_metabat_338 TaxID=2964704 RepID=UPI00286DAB75|nr:hypothetical protein [Chamaesiphon sp. VAR_69_metabat_338]
MPWTSLAILFLTYATFGWLLHDWTNDRLVWLLVAFGSTVLGGIVTYPSRAVSIGFAGFFKTDTRALILIIIGSIVTVLLLTWLQFFVDAVVLCAAGLLVSLDLKTRNWSNFVSLIIIIGWQLLGISVGLYSHHVYMHPSANLPAFFYIDYWFHLLDKWTISTLLVSIFAGINFPYLMK